MNYAQLQSRNKVITALPTPSNCPGGSFSPTHPSILCSSRNQEDKTEPQFNQKERGI